MLRGHVNPDTQTWRPRPHVPGRNCLTRMKQCEVVLKSSTETLEGEKEKVGGEASRCSQEYPKEGDANGA